MGRAVCESVCGVAGDRLTSPEPTFPMCRVCVCKYTLAGSEGYRYRGQGQKGMKGSLQTPPAAHLTPTPICPRHVAAGGEPGQWTLAETGSIGQTTPGPPAGKQRKWPPGAAWNSLGLGLSAPEGKQHPFRVHGANVNGHVAAAVWLSLVHTEAHTSPDSQRLGSFHHWG